MYAVSLSRMSHEMSLIAPFLPLQLLPRVQNHEGFCQEKVLGQVRDRLSPGERSQGGGIRPCSSSILSQDGWCLT